jgi:hypothetical protein
MEFRLIQAYYETKFSKGEGNSIILPIESGTIELNDNKIIILVD